jgi:hypothetical protein
VSQLEARTWAGQLCCRLTSNRRSENASLMSVLRRLQATGAPITPLSLVPPCLCDTRPLDSASDCTYTDSLPSLPLSSFLAQSLPPPSLPILPCSVFPVLATCGHSSSSSPLRRSSAITSTATRSCIRTTPTTEAETPAPTATVSPQSSSSTRWLELAAPSRLGYRLVNHWRSRYVLCRFVAPTSASDHFADYVFRSFSVHLT